jgi:hypothetical protein
MNKTLFSIHLMQSEDGQISIVSEAAGSQPEVYEIGIEIMANLKAAAACNPHMNLRVEPLLFSDSLH